MGEITPFQRPKKGAEPKQPPSGEPTHASQRASGKNPLGDAGDLLAERAGLDLTHYGRTVELLSGLVGQINPDRRNRLFQDNRKIVASYNLSEVVDYLNNADDHKISERPMFYFVLTQRLDFLRSQMRDMREKRREEDLRRRIRPVEDQKDPSETDKEPE